MNGDRAAVGDRRQLDARVAEIAADPGRTWGPLDALIGVLVIPASFAVVLPVVAAVPRLPAAVAAALATAVMAAVGVLAARRAVRQSGGAERALGLELPAWSDTGRVLFWAAVLVVLQGLAVGLVQLLIPSLRGVPVQNAAFLAESPLWAVLVIAFAAVVVAPVLEEVLFRGLVLRGLMLRIGFWPAALASSVCFGLFHAPGLGVRAVPLVVATGVFGLGQCLLTRITGRLGPAIGVHALRNAFAIAVVMLTAS